MGLLDSVAGLTSKSNEKDAQRAMEAMVLKQLLNSTGLFKGSDSPGAALHAEMFAEALADAVSRSGEAPLMPPTPMTNQASVSPASPQGQVTSAFGARVDPFTHQSSEHHGVDVAATEGTAIYALADGVVTKSGTRGGYGNSVELDHGEGTSTLYAHASQLLVREGESVHQGQLIARVGHTGRATGNHLHFELRRDGQAINPQRVLKSYGLRADEHLGMKP